MNNETSLQLIENHSCIESVADFFQNSARTFEHSFLMGTWVKTPLVSHLKSC